MSDLFQEGVSENFIIAVAHIMQSANWHTYQVLTKRSGRMAELLATKLAFVAREEHIWWGVSVENRRHGLPRIEDLRRAPAAARFLSIEPLLEDLGLIDLSGINWVIVGGESGPGARPLERRWVEAIRRQCRDANVPFFFKQWGGVRKKIAGRRLNGKTYDELPEIGSRPQPTRIERLALLDSLRELRIFSEFASLVHITI